MLISGELFPKIFGKKKNVISHKLRYTQRKEGQQRRNKFKLFKPLLFSHSKTYLLKVRINTTDGVTIATLSDVNAITNQCHKG